MEAWWKNNSLETRPIFGPTLLSPDINYAALSHLQWQSVGINKSNLPTQPPATEKPFVYLWIHLHTETFNWEDDSKINIPQPPPPNDTRHNSTPASHLSIPLWRLNMEKEKSQIAHEGESNIPLGRLLHPFRFNINILFVFFLLACRASLMKAAPSSPSLPPPLPCTSPNIICRWDFFIGSFFIPRYYAELPAACIAELSLAVKQY